MEITIKITFSPEEVKEGARLVTLGGPVPSLQPEMTIESSRPEEIVDLQANQPIPEMIGSESPPIPITELETEQELPVPEIIPEIPSEKKPKEETR